MTLVFGIFFILAVIYFIGVERKKRKAYFEWKKKTKRPWWYID